MISFKEIAGYVMVFKGVGLIKVLAILQGLAFTGATIGASSVTWRDLCWAGIWLGVAMLVAGLAIAAVSEKKFTVSEA